MTVRYIEAVKFFIASDANCILLFARAADQDKAILYIKMHILSPL